MEGKIASPARAGALAVVPAAGSGRRMGPGAMKPFIKLAGRPLVVHALETLCSSPSISGIIVAAHPECVGRMGRLIKRYRIKKLIAVVKGGRTRGESVRNCMARAGRGFRAVLVHDAARPFLSVDMVERSVRAAMEHGACVTAVPECDTVKLSDRDGFVLKTIDRSALYRAQTPQAFRADVARRMYGPGYRPGVTDDAMLAEASGVRVRILPGSYSNIKVTTREDIAIGEAIIAGRAARVKRS